MRSERKQDKCNITKIRPISQPINTVKTSIIRDAVLEYIEKTGKTLPEIANKMGWIVYLPYGSYGDGSRLKRTLGMRPDANPDPKYDKKYRQYMNYNTADQIIKAIDRDPWEFGI